jgi:hypothetical protein
MLRAPRATFVAVVERPQSLDLALLIIAIATTCSVGFLMTAVGRLAALDQWVRQMESVGVPVTDARYAQLRALLPYRSLAAAATIIVGWPLLWAGLAFVLRTVGNRGVVRATFAQVFAVVVHASSVLALRAIISAPVNYARESLGGATSVSALVPGLGDATFAGRLFGALDIFVLWWVLLIAVGVGMLYQVRAFPVARWLVGAYAIGAAALALTQALRGGI